MSNLLKIAFDYTKPSMTIETDWLLVIVAFVVILLVIILSRKGLFSWFNRYDMEVEISGAPKVKVKVERNNENLFIANRIYIELTTRKAAIPFDEENDVIDEVYDSWYKLFGIIRDEIKNVPGRYLKDHDPTSALIGLTTKILNDGLRPHLTFYQARFRKWYEEERARPENNQLSPQEIQRNYADYNNLVNSIKLVNKTLIEFAAELNKLIKG